MSTSTRTTLLAAASALMAAAPLHVASADVLTSYWVSTGVFEYRVTYMPDLDQKRNGLSNTGNNHCVPTSTINLFGYAANHGYSWMAPGAANWESNANFNAATSAISSMGSLMNTSGSSGTNGTGTWNGVSGWAFLNSGGLIGAVRKSRTSSYTPTVAKMVKLATQGWLMSFAYGRYDVVGTFGGVPTLDRDGGHAVTFVRAKRNSNEYSLRYRDPADNSTLSTQSEFVNKTVYPAAVTVHFGGIDVRTMNAIAYPSSDGRIRLVDSYWGIRPNFGYRFVNTGNLQGLGGGALQLMDPTPFEGSVNMSMPTINFSNFLIIEDVNFHPEMSDALVLARSVFNGQPNLLRLLDLTTGGLTTLTPAPEDLRQICPSREGFIYAFDGGGKVYKLDSEGDIDTATSTPPTPSGIWFDNTSDTLRLLSISERRIAKYNKNLGSVENFVVPTSVPMSGDGSVRVDPTTGRSWFKTDASALLYNFVPSAVGSGITTIALPTLPGGLRNFQFGDAGELYLMGDTIMKVLKRSPTNGNWFEDATSPFHNMPGGSRLMMFTSSSNDDPAIHDLPEWHSLPASDLLDIGESRPDCDADFDSDDVVNGADLGILLSKWGEIRGNADLNQDGVVNGADMGMLLSAWGNCL